MSAGRDVAVPGSDRLSRIMNRAGTFPSTDRSATVTRSTTASGGVAAAKPSRNACTRSAGPCTSTVTPCESFSTQPVSPRLLARRQTNGLKPTP